MMIGKGRIAFAHVEQIIDFPSAEGVEAYVKWNEDHHRTCYYQRQDSGAWTSHFSFANCVRMTSERQYTICVMLPYNGCNIGI